MSTAMITAISTGAAGILSAVTALVVALRGNVTARAALKTGVRAHIRLNALGAPARPDLPPEQAPPGP